MSKRAVLAASSLVLAGMLLYGLLAGGGVSRERPESARTTESPGGLLGIPAPILQARVTQFGPPEQMDVTSARKPGSYSLVKPGNVNELAAALKVEVPTRSSEGADAAADQGIRLAEVLMSALALDDFSARELDEVNLYGAPLPLRSDLMMRRATSPNLHWEGVNTGASWIKVLPFTTEALRTVLGYESRPLIFDGLDSNSSKWFLILHFETQHFGVARDGSGPACNTAEFRFIHDSNSGTTTAVDMMQSNIMEIAPKRAPARPKHGG